MSASRTIQPASIFYLDNLLATASAPYTSSLLVVLAKFFYIDIFSYRFLLDLSYSTPFSRPCGCLAHSLHLIPEFAGTSTNSTISYLVSLCLVSVALCSCLQSSQLSTSSTFSPRTFFLIFDVRHQDEDKGGSLPHQLLLFTFFFCWNVHPLSFCTEGAVAISMSCSHGTESPCL